MCPFCGGGWVTYAKKRGTHRCNICGLLDATPEMLHRWRQPSLPLSEEELELVSRASGPTQIVVKRLLATLGESGLVPADIRERTHQIEYNPYCAQRVLVRLVGPREGRLDKLHPSESKDVIGYGNTYAEAARDALEQKEGK